MAGKFLSLDEAAQRLGISPEEVQRLVDRKVLYPLRDGNTLKFRQDEIERHAADVGGSQAGSGSGFSAELELDVPGDSAAAASGATGSGGPVLSAAGSMGEISLGDELIIDGPRIEPPIEPPTEPITKPLDSQASDASGSAAITGSGGPAMSASGISLHADDALQPAPVPEKKPPPPAAREPFTSTLPIDLSGVDSAGTGSNATGSNIQGSEPVMELSGLGSSVGSALSGVVMEGGLSLEDSDVRKSGILSGEDFDDNMQSAISAVKSGAAQSGMEGDDFQTFSVDEDEESGSDIVADESATAGSSFLEDDGTGSSFGDGDASGDLNALGGDAEPDEDIGAGVGLVRDTTFSVWQLSGLICCALLMLTGGFVMYDLIRTIGTAEDLRLSSPLLAPLADLFGWKR